MNHTCEKCKQDMKTRQQLERHLNRKNPCDRKCSNCDYKAKTTRGLTMHRKQCKVSDEILEIEPVSNEKPVVKVLIKKTKPSMEPPPHFPLEDYDWEGLVETTEASESAIRKTRLSNDDTLMEKITVTVKYERVIIRAKNLREQIQHDGIIMSLKALNEGSNLQEIVKQLMYTVHAQKDKRFHSICKTDINRGSVRTYNRILDSDRCKWISHDSYNAPQIVNHHGRNLVMFLIQAGINLMELKFWISRRQVVMFTKDDKNLNKDVYVVVVYYDEDEKQIKMERNQKYACKEFVECPRDFEQEVGVLMQHVDARKQQIIQALNDTSLDQNQLDEFLNYSRPICIKSI